MQCTARDHSWYGHEEQQSIFFKFLKNEKERQIRKILQELFSEHPFSNCVFSVLLTGQMSLKESGYFPLNFQCLLPLKSSDFVAKFGICKIFLGNYVL